MSEIDSMEDNQANPLLGKDSHSALIVEAPLLRSGHSRTRDAPIEEWHRLRVLPLHELHNEVQFDIVGVYRKSRASPGPDIGITQ